MSRDEEASQQSLNTSAALCSYFSYGEKMAILVNMKSLQPSFSSFHNEMKTSSFSMMLKEI